MNSERTGERSNRRLRRLMAASLGIFICLPQATYSEAFCEMSGKAEVNMQQDKLTIQGVVKDGRDYCQRLTIVGVSSLHPPI